MTGKFRFNDIENMMLNIASEGQEVVWNELEKETDAIERCKLRKTYWQALNKILKGK